MELSNYFYDGGNVPAALTTQGTVVGANTRRKLTAAIVCNKTAVAKTFTVTLQGSTAATPVTLIDALTIGPHKSYLCPELIGRGMNAGGFIQTNADVTGMDFKYEAFEITNG